MFASFIYNNIKQRMTYDSYKYKSWKHEFIYEKQESKIYVI